MLKKYCVCVSHSVVSDSVRPHGPHQALLSMGFSRQEYWSGLPFPSLLKNIKGNIITTEKDAVKLALLGKTNIYALKLKTSFDIEKIML